MELRLPSGHLYGEVLGQREAAGHVLMETAYAPSLKLPRHSHEHAGLLPTVAGDPREIASVVLLRSDHNTHSLTAGDRYVKLAFHQKGAARKGELRVRAPKLPAQAIPGIYMLYVVDGAGVPSMAQRVYLKPEGQGRRAMVRGGAHGGLKAHSR